MLREAPDGAIRFTAAEDAKARGPFGAGVHLLAGFIRDRKGDAFDPRAIPLAGGTVEHLHLEDNPIPETCRVAGPVRHAAGDQDVAARLDAPIVAQVLVAIAAIHGQHGYLNPGRDHPQRWPDDGGGSVSTSRVGVGLPRTLGRHWTVTCRRVGVAAAAVTPGDAASVGGVTWGAAQAP